MSQTKTVPDYGTQAILLLASITDYDRRDDLEFQYQERLSICLIDGGLAMVDAQRVAFQQIQQAMEGGGTWR